jgi:hypothetical protein
LIRTILQVSRQMIVKRGARGLNIGRASQAWNRSCKLGSARPIEASALSFSITTAVMVMLRMVRRRVIVVGAGSAEKRATEAEKCQRYIHETKFEAIQSSDPANGFR